ncbi:MAG TPA: rhodanese-like domain-containing protein [Gemmatimonadales bacterium]|nr:rhodanese-like domain-containing protein [Gemmatimonadales bacterium]
MKLATYVLVTTAISLAPACGPRPGHGWSRVSPGAFAAELASPRGMGTEPAVVVDVREPELFRKGHIPGALNLPWPDAKRRAPAELDPARAVVLVCHSGPMGDELAAILARRGFRNVRNVAGGMAAWRGPVVKGGS